MEASNLLQVFARDKVATFVGVLIVLQVTTTYFMPRLMKRPDPEPYVPPPTCYYDNNGNCVPCFGTTCSNEECCRKKNHLCASAITGKLIECPDENRRYYEAFEDELWKFAREHPGAAALQALAIAIQLIPLVVCCFLLRKNLNRIIEEQEKERKRNQEKEKEKERKKKKETKSKKEEETKTDGETDEEEFEEITAEDIEETKVNTEHQGQAKQLIHKKKEKRRKKNAKASRK